MARIVMHLAVSEGRAIDLSNCEKNEKGWYNVTELFNGPNPPGDGANFCHLTDDEWIWSIGRHEDTREVWASTQMDLSESPAHQCLWIKQL